MRPVWRLPLTWAPRVVGGLVVALTLWGVFSLYSNPIRVGLSKEITVDWLTRDSGGFAVPMPSKRLEHQQAPPCAPPPSRQVEINGGCWFEVVESLPCGQLYEHNGKCYGPVREAPKLPTAVDP